MLSIFIIIIKSLIILIMTLVNYSVVGLSILYITTQGNETSSDRASLMASGSYACMYLISAFSTLLSSVESLTEIDGLSNRVVELLRLTDTVRKGGHEDGDDDDDYQRAVTKRHCRPHRDHDHERRAYSSCRSNSSSSSSSSYEPFIHSGDAHAHVGNAKRGRYPSLCRAFTRCVNTMIGPDQHDARQTAVARHRDDEDVNDAHATETCDATKPLLLPQVDDHHGDEQHGVHCSGCGRQRKRMMKKRKMKKN